MSDTQICFGEYKFYHHKQKDREESLLGKVYLHIGAYYACLHLQIQHDHFKTIIYMIVMAICILKLMNWRELITCYRARCLS